MHLSLLLHSACGSPCAGVLAAAQALNKRWRSGGLRRRRAQLGFQVARAPSCAMNEKARSRFGRLVLYLLWRQFWSV